MKIKAVLFDLDDTLYDYKACHEKAMKEVYRTFSKKTGVTQEEFDEILDSSKTEIKKLLHGTAASHNRVLYFQRMVEKFHKTVDAEMILHLYNAYWDTMLNSMRLFPGVAGTLKVLKKRGIMIAIITDLTAHIQIRKIHKLGISEYVDVLVTSEEAGRDKPHPTVFLLALNKLGIDPNDALVVGDSPKTDIEGGKAAGIKTVLVSKDAKEGAKPDFVAGNISEIPGIIDRLKK